MKKNESNISIGDSELNPDQPEDNEIFHHRGQWGSSLEFILTVIGYAVGLGNVWRFPFLVFKNGGAAFLVPFFILLFLVGIPMFFLEVSIGQFSGLSPVHTFEKMVPLFKGLGYAQIVINLFIGFYYNVIIAYSLYYLGFSLRTEVPWKNCPDDKPDCFVRHNLSSDCFEEKNAFYARNITVLRSPSEVYFYDEVLEMTDGIQNFGGINLHLAFALFISWSIVLAAISKGVQSLGKISYFTSTFPYVMLTILVFKGLSLNGAGEGISFYVGRFDISALVKPEIWKDAAVQVFFALSSCSGGIITMASFSAFDNNIIRDSLLVPILDCFTGFYAGFAIFSVLGYMYLTKCVNSFAEVAAQGPELAFVVYPEGLSLMGVLAPLFSVLFFLMMISLGFGTEFSIMESVLSTVIDLFHEKLNTNRKKYILRIVFCGTLFVLGLVMVARNGLFVLNLIDDSVSGYPLLVSGLLQVIVVIWIYGAENLKRDIECMIGKKPDLFWKVWFISWKYVCPLVLIVILIATIIMPSTELNIRGITYPLGAKVVGWIISLIPLGILIYFGIQQAIAYKYDWKKLLSPDDSYYRNYKRYLRHHKLMQSRSNLALTTAAASKTSFQNQGFIDDSFNSNAAAKKDSTDNKKVVEFNIDSQEIRI